jgi:hypothetical protein
VSHKVQSTSDGTMPQLRCECGRSVVQKSQNGRYAIRAKGPVHFSKASCEFDCHFCGRPVTLTASLSRSVRFVLGKNGK